MSSCSSGVIDRTQGAEARLPSSATSCAGMCTTVSCRIGRSRPTACATLGSETALPIRLMAFLPGQGLGGAANHWNGQTWRWSEYDPALRLALRRATARRRFPPTCRSRTGASRTRRWSPTTICSRSSSASPARPANRGQAPAGWQSFRGAAPQRIPAEAPATPRRAYFSEAPKARLQAVSRHRPPTLRRLYQSGRHEAGAVPILRSLRTFHLRSAGQGIARSAALPDAEQRKGFEVRFKSHVLGIRVRRKAKRARGVHYVDP